MDGGDVLVISFGTATMVAGKALKQITNYTDFPVIDINNGGGKLIFEQAQQQGFPVREVVLWETQNSCAAYR